MSALLLLQGTALALPLQDASVHTCVTSPPYMGLRDYGTGAWQGGEAACDHSRLVNQAQFATSTLDGGKKTVGHAQEGYRARCGRCGATRVDAQLGLEESVEDYVAAMVQVFREVWRVLHPTGVLFINMGDSYQDKQLQGIPWKVAFGLQSDGWILRSDIIWEKPSCMPESTTDRPTRSHEYIFLFSKQAHYHYDSHAIREPATMTPQRRLTPQPRQEGRYANDAWKEPRILRDTPAMDGNPDGRNARTVWRIPSEGFAGNHFASFPQALVRRCLLAGAPTQVCAACGAPWRRDVERSFRPMTDRSPEKLARASGIKGIDISRHDATTPRGYTDVATLGWHATCPCNAGIGKAVVLDPFVGSGTTLLVARELGHHAVGIDLSLSYLKNIARERLGLAAMARWEGHTTDAPALDYSALPLFSGGGGMTVPEDAAAEKVAGRR